MRAFPPLSVLLSLVIILSGVGTTQVVVNNSASVRSSTSFDYILIIIMENHPLNYTTNTAGVIGNPSAPFINLLAKNYSLATNYFSLAGGSLPNYIALTDADLTSVNGSCTVPGPKCRTTAINIVDRVESSGRTWKAYMEDYSGGCDGTGSPLYAADHNPFIFYTDITSNNTRCSHIVSANPGGTGFPDSQLISDLSSRQSAPNYMWLTPNNCDNMHGTGNGACSSNLVANGDGYLSQLVPEIFKSTIFRTQRAALFVVFDEPSGCTYNTCPVPAIWAGPVIKPNYVSKTLYTHYSLLTTLEHIWAFPPLTTNDQTSTSMTEFFP